MVYYLFMTAETLTHTVDILHAGQMDYRAAWARQRRLGKLRSAGAIGDLLMLVEHPHTYTFGSRPKPEQLLVPHETLAAQGVALVEADRGGDITYHGPGQIVGYPILKLSRHGGDIAALPAHARRNDHRGAGGLWRGRRADRRLNGSVGRRREDLRNRRKAQRQRRDSARLCAG